MLGAHKLVALRYLFVILDGVDIDVAQSLYPGFQFVYELLYLRDRLVFLSLKLQGRGISHLIFRPHIGRGCLQFFLQLFLLGLDAEHILVQLCQTGGQFLPLCQKRLLSGRHLLLLGLMASHHLFQLLHMHHGILNQFSQMGNLPAFALNHLFGISRTFGQ